MGEHDVSRYAIAGDEVGFLPVAWEGRIGVDGRHSD